MYRGEYIFSEKSLGKNNRILKVVTFPRHECNLKVTSESELAVLCGVALSHYLARNNLVTLPYDRFQSNGCILVCLSVERKLVNSNLRIKTYKSLTFCLFVFNMYLTCIYIDNFTFTSCVDLSPGVFNNRSLKSCSYNRRFRPYKRNGLPHHVRTHERTVGVVMLKERNK